MGRKSHRDELYDSKIHSSCSKYMFNRFSQLPTGDKKDSMAMDIIKKFGVSTIDNAISTMTPEEKEKALDVLSTLRRYRSAEPSTN